MIHLIKILKKGNPHEKKTLFSPKWMSNFCKEEPSFKQAREAGYRPVLIPIPDPESRGKNGTRSGSATQGLSLCFLVWRVDTIGKITE
jgi:hypothetical protein